MKVPFVLLSIVAILLALDPFRHGVAEGAKSPPPALAKISERLQVMIADHPKRAAIGVVTPEIPEKLARLSNRARYLCGEIKKEEFLRRSDEITATWNDIFANRQKTGQYDSDQFLSFAEGAIIDYSLP